MQLPYVPAYKALYDIQSLEATEEKVVALYPELLRCMGCNTCTRSCPMNLEDMNYVSAVIRGEWETVKHLSMECIMCGMCAARCPAELAPFNIAMLIRRMVGKGTHKAPAGVTKRLNDIKAGVYREAFEKLKAMNTQELLVQYKDFQASRGKAV